MLCSASTLYSSSDGAPLITFTGSSSHNLSTTTSTCLLIIASPRGPEHTAEAPLLQSACKESDTPLANVFLKKVGKSPATRCGGDAVRPCNGDTTAMPHCHSADRDATAQKPAQKSAQHMQIFLEKIQEDSDTYRSGYLQAFLAKYLHIVAHSDIRAAHHCARFCKYAVLCLKKYQ